MRLFIAIQLSDAIKDSLIEAQNDMYDQGIRGNYTEEETCMSPSLLSASIPIPRL